MEQKKTDKANLENKRGYFYEIGFIVTLLIMWGAFEYASPVEKAEELGQIEVQIEDEELMPITRQEDIQLPPPPPQQTVTEVFEVIDDKIEVQETFEINEGDADDEIQIQDIKPVENEPEEEPEEQQTFLIVEDMPEFPGGDVALRKFIAENVRYPEVAKENDIQGTVYVRFVVDKDGSVTNVELLRGVDPLLDKEAIRVVQSLPKWKPGRQRGKAVKVSHSVPIKFALQN